MMTTWRQVAAFVLATGLCFGSGCTPGSSTSDGDESDTSTPVDGGSDTAPAMDIKGDGAGETGAPDGDAEPGSSDGDADDDATGCGDVPYAGVCDGDVFRWCDPVEQTVHELDCNALNAECRATRYQSVEGVTNGCFVENAGCTDQDKGCDGSQITTCDGGDKHIYDCNISDGPGATCQRKDQNGNVRVYCQPEQSCPSDLPPQGECRDGIAYICNENGKVSLQNCNKFENHECGTSPTSESVCCVKPNGNCFP